MSKSKKYNYQSHDEVPDILWSYMDSIVDVDFPVKAIEIEDVNKFLNFRLIEGFIFFKRNFFH